MAQSVLEMAKDLVSAQIQAGSVTRETFSELLDVTHQTLLSLRSIDESGPAETLVPATDWQTSITKHAVSCLECGVTFKQLSTRHLRRHGLDGRSYRAKYGIPRTQPLSAKTTTALRQKVVQQSRPWEKASTYQKAHGQHETEVKAVKKTAKSPASAKRKTKARKSAARKS